MSLKIDSNTAQQFAKAGQAARSAAESLRELQNAFTAVAMKFRQGIELKGLASKLKHARLLPIKTESQR